jgi:hypothetical protein
VAPRRLGNEHSALKDTQVPGQIRGNPYKDSGVLRFSGGLGDRLPTPRWHGSGYHAPEDPYVAARQHIDDRQRSGAGWFLHRAEAEPRGNLTSPRSLLPCALGKIRPCNPGRPFRRRCRHASRIRLPPACGATPRGLDCPKGGSTSGSETICAPLPDPEVIANEIANDLQTALDQFRSIGGR